MSPVPRPKILCVDDETDVLQALERLLKGRFDVLTAPSPDEALRQLKDHPDCAVVLSDFRMPGMNGVELLRRVRDFYPLTARAILSGQIDLQQVSAAINRSDIHKFLLKPWENEYLLVQMSEALQLHHTLLEKAHFEHLSVTDPVTQVTNHRFFQDQLRREIGQAAGKLVLLIFDVDRFKDYNDRFGHPQGDRLLFGIAKELESLAGAKGRVSRYGGEEFTLILPDHDVEEGLRLAERIRARIETAFSLDSGPAVTVSAGLAVYPDHGIQAGRLIENADRALYEAKRRGRNQVAVAEVKTDL